MRLGSHGNSVQVLQRDASALKALAVRWLAATGIGADLEHLDPLGCLRIIESKRGSREACSM